MIKKDQFLYGRNEKTSSTFIKKKMKFDKTARYGSHVINKEVVGKLKAIHNSVMVVLNEKKF